MAQLADAVDSKSTVRKDMRVRIPLRARGTGPRRAQSAGAGSVPYARPVPDPTSLSKPVVRRMRRLALLAAALTAVVLARDRIISDAERRDAERLGLDR